MTIRAHSRRPVAIDLFCGAGGLSLGLEQAGFDVVVAIDSDPIHTRIYSRNFPKTAVLTRDITTLTASDLLEPLRRRAVDRRESTIEIDCVAGGPSCQGFSVIGRRDPNDTRNSLVFDFARLVTELRPRYFLMENVPGLFSARNRPTLEILKATFISSGYSISTSPWLLDARDFGVPQRRKRLFLVGVREGQPIPSRPRTSHEMWTVSDAIADLVCPVGRHDPVPTRMPAADQRGYAEWLRAGRDGPLDRSAPRLFDASQLSGTEVTRHSAVVIRRFEELAPGTRDRVSRLDRLMATGVSPTLRAGTGFDHGRHTSARPVHYELPRVITTREAARLQAFPDWFQFHRTKWHAFRQIGNAVPPRLAAAVAREIVQALGLEPSIPDPVDLRDPEPSAALSEVA